MNILKCGNSEEKSWGYLEKEAGDGEIYETSYQNTYLIVLVNHSTEGRTILYTDGMVLQAANPSVWCMGRFKKVDATLCFEIKR